MLRTKAGNPFRKSLALPRKVHIFEGGRWTSAYCLTIVGNSLYDSLGPQLRTFAASESRMKVDLSANTRLPSKSVRIMCEVLLEHGLDPASLISLAGVDPGILEDPWSTLHASQETNFQRLFSRATDHIPGLWYRTGLKYRVTAYGPLGLAALTSANFTDALRVLLELQSLRCGLFEYDLIEQDGVAVACTANTQSAPLAMHEFLHERFIGSALIFFQDLFQQKVPLDRIESALTRPQGWLDLDQAWDTEIVYGAPKTTLYFRSGAGALPLPMANAFMAEDYRSLCLKMMDKIPRRDAVVTAVQQLLQQGCAPFPTASEAAGRINLSERSLHRKLSEQGASYQDILDGVRLRRARALLDESTLSMAEISERLGFAEMTSFTRFFRRVAGTPPLAYRRTSLGLSPREI